MARYARGNPAHWWKGRSCGAGSRAPGAMFVSPVRRAMSLGSLGVLTLILGGGWYVTRPARISAMAEGLLTNLIGGQVHVGSGHLSLSGTLLLSDVQVQTQSENGQPPLPVFSAEQIEARFDWISLMLGELRSTQLTAVRPTLYLVEDRDIGKWNYEILKKKSAETKPAAPPRKVANLPVMVLRDARIQWGEVTRGQLVEGSHATVDGQFTPTLSSPSAYHFEVVQRNDAGGDAISLAGDGGNAGGAGVTVTGSWDLNENRFSAGAEDIRLNDALRRILPREVRSWWTEHELEGAFSRLWVTFDKDQGLVVGADAERLAMVMKVTPPLGEDSYRVKVSDMQGELSFGMTKSTVKAKGVKGKVLGFAFEADAEVAGASATSALSLDLRFPGAMLAENYPPLFIAYPAGQDLLQRLAPHGMFDLTVAVRRAEGDAKVQVNGDILCHDARMRFGPLPYPLTHVNGHVEFDQQTVSFRDVRANADETLVHINGTTGTSPSSPAIDFRVWSDDATFDDRLAACLPEKFANVWDQFVVNGKGSFECVVKRGLDVTVQPAVRVNVALTDGSGYAKAAPYRFYGAKGEFTLAADQTEVKSLTVRCGSDRSGMVRLTGVIKHPGGDVSNLLPHLTIAAELPLEKQLFAALPENYSQKLDGLAIGGVATFEGDVERVTATAGDPTGGVHVAGAGGVRNGTVGATDGKWEIEDIGAHGRVERGRLEITDAAGKIEGLRVGATGAIDGLTQRGALQLSVAGEDVKVPAVAPSKAPARVQELWKAFAPQGKVDVQGHASVKIGEAGAATQPAGIAVMPGVTVGDYACTVTAKGMSIAPASLPEPVHDIEGSVTATPGKVVVIGMSAKSGSMTLTGNGSFATDTGAIAADGVLVSSGLPGPWMAKLPDGVNKFFDAHKTGGTLTLTVAKMERAGWEAPWLYTADLAASRFTMDGLVALNAEQLRLAGDGAIAQGSVDFAGQFTGRNVELAGKTFDTLGATLTLGRVDHSLKVTDIDGRVSGGSVQGTITVEPNGAGGQGKYEADLSLKDAELAGLLVGKNGSADDRKRAGEGRVSGTLAVQQTFGDQGDRTGRGELMVEDGKIYNVPLAMGLMQLVTLRLPVASAFDRASMSYFLRDNKVTFERILLESRSINLAGQGTLSLKDKGLNLNFVTESPNEVHLPIISPIINQIREELLQLAVTGTVDNPRVTPVPLSALSAPLRALLPHHQQASEH